MQLFVRKSALSHICSPPLNVLRSTGPSAGAEAVGVVPAPRCCAGLARRGDEKISAGAARVERRAGGARPARGEGKGGVKTGRGERSLLHAGIMSEDS